jgi:hypothetical protein
LSAQDVWSLLAHLPFRIKMLLLASLILLIEVGFRALAPKSRAYRLWTSVFMAIGVVWTAVLLAIIYVFSVGPISLAMRLLAKDPLDRALRPEPSFWRRHEPNPLGPAAATRHQF